MMKMFKFDKKIFLGVIIGIIISSIFFFYLLEQQRAMCLNSAQEIFSPGAKEKIINLIKEAKKSIDIQMYVLTDKDIISQLIESADRGVKIRIILEYRIESDIKKVIEALEHKNIEVRFSPSKYKLMHSKMVIIDREKVLIGSINFSKSALETNREVAILVGGEIIKKYLEIFESDWRDSQITFVKYS
ncbi:MAG: phospholipase D-like domain-containing protein [Candidatus Anstonellaceae archaeon]